MDGIRIKAKQDYMEGMKYKDICDKYDISMNTLKSWVSRNNWSDERKRGAHKDKRGAPKKQIEKLEEIKMDTIEYKKEIEKLEDADLTDKQRLFCCYYIESFNATNAYQKAYQCNRETARVNASRLLTNANIKMEIDRLTEECLQEKELSSKIISKRVFQKYIDIAFADITDYMEFGVEDIPLMDNNTGKQSIDGEGNLIFYQRNYVYFKNNDEVDGTIISEIGQGKDGIKLKLQDKMKALDFLAGNISLLSSLDEVKIESEKVKVQKLQLEIEKLKNQDELEVFEDDGFIDALKGEISEVWSDEDTEED